MPIAACCLARPNDNNSMPVIAHHIILTGYGSIDSAAECTRLGAFGYLEKPADFDKLIDVLKQAYTERLKKKFKRDQKRMEDIEFLSMGASPMSILASLRRLDDDEK